MFAITTLTFLLLQITKTGLLNQNQKAARHIIANLQFIRLLMRTARHAIKICYTRAKTCESKSCLWHTNSFERDKV